MTSVLRHLRLPPCRRIPFGSTLATYPRRANSLGIAEKHPADERTGHFLNWARPSNC